MVSVHLKVWEELSRSSPSASQQLPLRIRLVKSSCFFLLQAPVLWDAHQSEGAPRHRQETQMSERFWGYRHTPAHTHFYRNQFSNQIPKLIIYTPSHGVLFNLVSSLSGTGNWGVKRFVESTNFQGKARGSRRIQVSALPSLDHPVLLSQLLQNFFKNRI